VIAEYRYIAAAGHRSDDDDDDDDDDDELDPRVAAVGLPSGVYGRCVPSKHYTSFSLFDHVADSVSLSSLFLPDS